MCYRYLYNIRSANQSAISHGFTFVKYMCFYGSVFFLSSPPYVGTARNQKTESVVYYNIQYYIVFEELTSAPQ